MSRKELAAALGISRAMLWRLERAGMPGDNLAAALQWRAANLVASRIKGTKRGTKVDIPAAEPVMVDVPGAFRLAEPEEPSAANTIHGSHSKTLGTVTSVSPPSPEKPRWRKMAAPDRDAWQRSAPDAFAGHWLDEFMRRWNR